jgi:hypothetical protein
VIVQQQEKWLRVPFRYEGRVADTLPWLAECPYPYHEATILDAKGTVVFRGNPALLMQISTPMLVNPDDEQHIDLEVLYIGQAYGGDGSRNAVDRLKSHSTLQQMYYESSKLNPDSEIWLVLFHLEDLGFVISIDGADKNTITSESEDTEHMRRFIDVSVTEQVCVNFAEAALIKYFQPEYNIRFKDVFPSPAHKTYAQCYDLEANSLVLEIQTEQVHTRLFSKTAAASWIHMHTFSMYDSTDRKAMFDFVSLKGSSI